MTPRGKERTRIKIRLGSGENFPNNVPSGMPWFQGSAVPVLRGVLAIDQTTTGWGGGGYREPLF